MKENYIKALTGLRTIAASMVFFHHFNPFHKNSIYYGIVNEFHIGVTIFFVLSGFLIGFRYSEKKVNVKKYFVNRFARIYPIFFIFTLITFLVYPTNNLEEIFLNFTLLKGFFDDYKFTGIAQGWTLTVEECFYAFALILFFLIRKKKILIIAMIPFILLGVTFVFQEFILNTNYKGFLIDAAFVRNYTFLGRSFEFISGFLLSYFISKINFKLNIFTWIGTLCIISICVALFLLKGHESVGVKTIQGQILNNYFLPIFGIVPLIYGLIKEETIISRILSTNLFEKLGKSSYVFYIIHMGVVQKFISSYFNSYFVLYFMLLVVSWLVFKYVEEPLNIAIKKLTNQRKLDVKKGVGF